MFETAIYLIALMVHHNLIEPAGAVIYTYEDVELRRIFPSEFPLDIGKKTGPDDIQPLGRYAELRHYFLHPMSELNSHFEEMLCYNDQGKRTCSINVDRFSLAENAYFMSQKKESPTDQRRVYCIFLICFTLDELDTVVTGF